MADTFMGRPLVAVEPATPKGDVHFGPSMRVLLSHIPHAPSNYNCLGCGAYLFSDDSCRCQWCDRRKEPFAGSK